MGYSSKTSNTRAATSRPSLGSFNKAANNAYYKPPTSRPSGLTPAQKGAAMTQAQKDAYSEYGAMMQLAGMSNHAKFADGAQVARVDPFGEDVRSSGGSGGGGRGGGRSAAAALAAALAAQLGIYDRAEQVGRSNAGAATGNINNIYDELNARLGQQRSQYGQQTAEQFARMQQEQAGAAGALRDLIAPSGGSLQAQFGDQLAGSVGGGNVAQLAALQAALQSSQGLDRQNYQRMSEIADGSFGQRVADSGTARAASQQKVQNELGALLQELEAARAQARAGAVG